MISGFEIGHHAADEPGWLTGTTVVLARAGAVAGVDVRGGGPGTRETDLLDPTAMVQQAHAVVLTGGSAYGLAAADGVMLGLEAAGIGFPVGPGQIVPIVPAAVIFDLGRGGHYRHRPTADFGARALAAATGDDPPSGCVGAGVGAVCGGLKGGFGYAESTAADGSAIGAAVVVNAVGSAVDPETGRLWAAPAGPAATGAERTALAAAYAAGRPSLNTTIGVVLTDATLTKAQASKVAAVAHDGLARTIRPAHAMNDGDTIFAMASGHQPVQTDPFRALLGFNALLGAAAEVFAAACVDALLSATGRGSWPAYRELTPSITQG